MMFNSQVQAMVQKSVIEAKWAADKDRRQETENRIDLYADDYEEIILEALKLQYCKENYDRISKHVNQSQNILKRVINEISMVYKVEATRSLAKAESPRYEELKKSLNLGVKMKKVNRFTNLLNETLMKIGVRGGRIVYDIITPNICGVIQNQDDPTQADAIWYQIVLTNTQGSYAVESEYYVYEITGDAYVLDTQMKLKRTLYVPQDTPFRYESGAMKGQTFIPLVVFHRQDPDFTFWDQDSGRDLYNAAVGVGCKMTLMDYYFKNASHKQIYMIGQNMTIPAKQVLDPMTVLTAQHGPDGNAEIGVLDVQNRMVELIEGLKYHVNSIITTYGISPDQWNMSGSEISGRALKIRNRALLEAREDQIPIYSAGEKELFEKTRAINNNLAKAMRWGQIPDDDFALDFGEIDWPEDPVVEMDMLTRKLKAGIISLGQFYQAFNADITDEAEAEKMIIANLNKMRELRDANPSLDEALNAILGGQKNSAPPPPGAGGQGGNLNQVLNG